MIHIDRESVEKTITEFDKLEKALDNVLTSRPRPMYGRPGRFLRWKEFYQLSTGYRNTLRTRRKELQELLDGLL